MQQDPRPDPLRDTSKSLPGRPFPRPTIVSRPRFADLPFRHVESHEAAMFPFPDFHTNSHLTVRHRMAELEAIFGSAELGGASRAQCADAFIHRIGRTDFWQDSGSFGPGITYSPAALAYLEARFGINGAMNFEEYMRVWAQGFFNARQDPDTAAVVLTLFLHENLAALRDIYVLSEIGCQHAGSEDMQHCLKDSSNAELLNGPEFANWVLWAWLPYHLRQACAGWAALAA
jgi:hypothetical protein